jgi:hypothetical protein
MRRLAPAFCLAVLVCACAGPPKRAPVVSLPVRYEGPSGVAQLAPADLDRWWLLFDDPELTSLEDEAFRASPDARTATARLVEAGATRGGLVAQTFPTGDPQGNATHSHASNIGPPSNSLFPVGGTTDTEALNFNVSWELDFFGRLAQKRRAANADLAATRFDVEGARASLAASVADSLFVTRGLAIQLDDARANARIEAGLEDVAARKATVGLGPTSDADRVAGDLAVARSQVEDLTAQLHAARRQLLILDRPRGGADRRSDRGTGCQGSPSDPADRSGGTSIAATRHSRGGREDSGSGSAQQAAPSGLLSHLHHSAGTWCFQHHPAWRRVHSSSHPVASATDHGPWTMVAGPGGKCSGAEHSPTEIRGPGRGCPNHAGGDCLRKDGGDRLRRSRNRPCRTCRRRTQARHPSLRRRARQTSVRCGLRDAMRTGWTN